MPSIAAMKSSRNKRQKRTKLNDLTEKSHLSTISSVIAQKVSKNKKGWSVKATETERLCPQTADASTDVIVAVNIVGEISKASGVEEGDADAVAVLSAAIPTIAETFGDVVKEGGKKAVAEAGDDKSAEKEIAGDMPKDVNAATNAVKNNNEKVNLAKGPLVDTAVHGDNPNDSAPPRLSKAARKRANKKAAKASAAGPTPTAVTPSVKTRKIDNAVPVEKDTSIDDIFAKKTELVIERQHDEEDDGSDHEEEKKEAGSEQDEEESDLEQDEEKAMQVFVNTIMNVKGNAKKKTGGVVPVAANGLKRATGGAGPEEDDGFADSRGLKSRRRRTDDGYAIYEDKEILNASGGGNVESVVSP